jgi:hypothetical protein
MRRKLRIAVIAFSCLLVLALVGAVVIYQASQHVPEFYAQAITVDPRAQVQASQEMGARVTTLYNDARRKGEWQAMFSAEQINGWLAVDLVEKHGDALPAEISDPRVEITPDTVTLALQYDDGGIATVFSLGVDVFISQENEVAFRVRRARAGALPLPLGDILDRVSTAATELELPLRWTEIDGDPVAVLTIAPADSESDDLLILEKIELRAGEIYLSGRTLPGGAESGPQSQLSRKREKLNRQR